MAKYCNFTKEELHFDKYYDGNNALIAQSPEEGPICTCSVNMPGEPQEDDEIFIKDYSENEGVLQDLIDIGIVSKPIDTIPTGFVHVYKCKILNKNL